MDEILGPQITHLGFRERRDITDVILGFRLFGEITSLARVEFYWSDQYRVGMTKVASLWTPTLLNTQGFRESVYGRAPLRTRPFVFPDKFEFCDGNRIQPCGEAILGLNNESVFLVCFSISGLPRVVQICGQVSYPVEVGPHG